MSATVGPSRSVCSSSTPVTQVATARHVRVGSSRAPIPASITANSTQASANTENAAVASASKKAGAVSGSALCSPATAGRTYSSAATNLERSIGEPPILIRSFHSSRWGEVNVPVRKPAARSSASV